MERMNSSVATTNVCYKLMFVMASTTAAMAAMKLQTADLDVVGFSALFLARASNFSAEALSEVVKVKHFSCCAARLASKSKYKSLANGQLC